MSADTLSQVDDQFTKVFHPKDNRPINPATPAVAEKLAEPTKEGNGSKELKGEE